MTRKNLIELHRARQAQAQVGTPLQLIRIRSFALIAFAILLALILAAPTHAQTSITIGDTKVESASDNGNGNMVLAQAATLSQAATIASLSFYVKKPSGNLILGVYDSTGPKGGPGKLVATTSSFATASGWNTANVSTPASLAAGTYWLAYLPSSSSLSFEKQNTSGSCVYQTQTFSKGIPVTFATSTANCSPTTWSFYATLAPSGSSESTGSSGGNGGRHGGGGSGGGSATNGKCGSASGTASSAAPTSNLCSAGTASTVAGNGPWNWMCAGSNGGSSASCQAPVASPTPVNGTCGSANGVATTSAPNSNLCSTGTASAVAGNGPWNWMCAGANGGTPGSCQAPLASGGGGGTGGGTGSGGSGSPTLIQHVASSANPVGLGISGNNFKIPLPNPVQAGDALVLGITYPHGSTPTVSDSLGQGWGGAVITKDGGSGNYASQIYVLCGSAGGTDTITVGLGQSTLPFQYTASEFNNVAPSACVDGSAGGASLSPGGSAAINPGSFTPSTNNDANGGHIIWNYTALSSIANGNPSSWSAATGFTLLDADISWFDKQGFPHASQWYVQSANAAVTPSIASTGDTADTFNSVSVALRVANGGGTMPSTIHVNKILHQSWTGLSGGSLVLQLPATGNLRVLAFTVGLNSLNITSITDNEGGSWNIEQSGGDSSQIWYSANRSANPNLIVTIHTSGASDTNSVRFFDIQNASASPVDVSAGTDPTVCTSGSISNQPTITTTGPNELVIATMGIGDGPGLGMASGAPSGAVWDLTNYSGEVDNDLMENADAAAHVYATTAGVEHWNWTITVNGNNSCTSEAVAFR